MLFQATKQRIRSETNTGKWGWVRMRTNKQPKTFHINGRMNIDELTIFWVKTRVAGIGSMPRDVKVAAGCCRQRGQSVWFPFVFQHKHQHTHTHLHANHIELQTCVRTQTWVCLLRGTQAFHLGQTIVHHRHASLKLGNASDTLRPGLALSTS